ncbi:uncharacterized protein LOC126990240 [Eriocheir sinensis]|uniref:uncharacterized protein LOC126990240 n=1 Tax=Eriocheir sinensis TaxID=95602 RepID=UPI0021CAD1A7|nr:uncharacterized protein LOC126990240 [Eriocheir sinensis]XP_050704756.1 uncharacterized protein LOC126990240 [Eriocheir sinensis]XP_050704760.1 uncharacterized protein LOC126990240 [Eriocheir sinensis]
MDVVLGHRFPQHSQDFPPAKGVMYNGDKTPDTTMGLRNLNDKENSTPLRSHEVDAGRATSTHITGGAKHSRQLYTTLQGQRLSSDDRKQSTAEEAALDKKETQTNEGRKQVSTMPDEATVDKKASQPNDKPKMQSILRRTPSTASPEERDTRDSAESSDGKDGQDSGGEREMSWGRRAWDMTQRMKAQMREEFFKVPYEECNREAARSLGGRLNKSEPRLHTLGKDRKKRNSLSYKRRVHFDLDYDDEEDRKPLRTRSKSFEAADPVKKVVVSIYSIDNKPKSVIQPDSLKYLDAAGGRHTPTTARAKSARPTDLDSLQQASASVADRQQQQQPTDQVTTPTATTRTPLRADSTTTTTTRNNLHTTPAPQASSPSPLSPQEPTFTPRHSPPSPLHTHTPYTPHSASQPSSLNADQPKSSPHVSNPPQPAPTPSTPSLHASDPPKPAPPPVPAPRSRLIKAHSLPATQPTHHSTLQPDNQAATQSPYPPILEAIHRSISQPTHQPDLQPSPPRPDYLNLGLPSSVRAAIQVFTPTKTLLHPQRAAPTHTERTSPPAPSTANTPATITTLSSPMVSPVAPSTPQSPRNTPNMTSAAPIPMPRKRISVSQQTPTPQQSPYHQHNNNNNTTAKNINNNNSAHARTAFLSSMDSQAAKSNVGGAQTVNGNLMHKTLEEFTSVTDNKTSLNNNSHAFLSSVDSQAAKSNVGGAQTVNGNLMQKIQEEITSVSDNKTNLNNNSHARAAFLSSLDSQAAKSNVDGAQTVNGNLMHKIQEEITSVSDNKTNLNNNSHARAAFLSSMDYQAAKNNLTNAHTLNPMHKTQEFTSLTDNTHKTNLNNKSSHARTALLSSMDSQAAKDKLTNAHTVNPMHKIHEESASFTTVYPEKSGRTGAARRRKSTNLDRENCVNILMTKGESYAKHNIVISSHTSSAPPSVTVRKVLVPSTTPSRSSPSPTPSCASSSCSFGSSGSSSGCYSGSPSPTPTPSPTRIRASCTPTDL